MSHKFVGQCGNWGYDSGYLFRTLNIPFNLKIVLLTLCINLIAFRNQSSIPYSHITFHNSTNKIINFSIRLQQCIKTCATNFSLIHNFLNGKNLPSISIAWYLYILLKFWCQGSGWWFQWSKHSWDIAICNGKLYWVQHTGTDEKNSSDDLAPEQKIKSTETPLSPDRASYIP